MHDERGGASCRGTLLGSPKIAAAGVQDSPYVSASVTLPVATTIPSAVTVPSTLYRPPCRPATRACASSTTPAAAAAGNLNGPIAATQNCTGGAASPSGRAAIARPPTCATIS